MTITTNETLRPTDLKKGDRLVFQPDEYGRGYTAKTGAIAIATGRPALFPQHIAIEWDRETNDLAGTQMDGGYSPAHFRYEVAPVEADTITVEDSAAILALPVGTILHCTQAPSISVRRGLEYRLVWHGYEFDGLPVSVKVEDMNGSWFPMTVTNPEILGNFESVEDEIEDDLEKWERGLLGEWERELLGETESVPTFDPFDQQGFSLGDKVRVTAANDFENGLIGEVIDFQPNNGEDIMVRITEGDRLVGEEMTYNFGAVELIEDDKPEFKVGDRVEVTGHSAFWDGPATIVRIHGSEHSYNTLVVVQPDNYEFEGGFPLGYIAPLVEHDGPEAPERQALPVGTILVVIDAEEQELEVIYQPQS